MADDHLQKTGTSEDTETIRCRDVLDSVAAADENPSNLEPKQLKFSEDEETLIIRMYNLVGDRWSLIAGRIPGRNAEEIEKYWNSRQSTKGAFTKRDKSDG